MIDHATVKGWVTGYERAWRTSGTDGLLSLFTPGAAYLHSPYSEPVVRIDAIQEMWEGDREGPDEAFTITTDMIGPWC